MMYVDPALASQTAPPGPQVSQVEVAGSVPSATLAPTEKSESLRSKR